MLSSIDNIILNLEHLNATNSVSVLICDEKLEEQLISPACITKDSDGKLVIDISDQMSNILIQHEQDIFQRCLDNTPEEYKTKETFELLCKMFNYGEKKGT